MVIVLICMRMVMLCHQMDHSWFVAMATAIQEWCLLVLGQLFQWCHELRELYLDLCLFILCLPHVKRHEVVVYKGYMVGGNTVHWGHENTQAYISCGLTSGEPVWTLVRQLTSRQYELSRVQIKHSFVYNKLSKYGIKCIK